MEAQPRDSTRDRKMERIMRSSWRLSVLKRLESVLTWLAVILGVPSLLASSTADSSSFQTAFVQGAVAVVLLEAVVLHVRRAVKDSAKDRRLFVRAQDA